MIRSILILVKSNEFEVKVQIKVIKPLRRHKDQVEECKNILYFI